MRKSRDETAATKERIVRQAAEIVRQRGVEGLGVADLMREVGLTHGGFYRHFKSKDELVAAAFVHAFTDSRDGLTRRTTDLTPTEAFERVITSYLSDRHRNDPGHGCAIAALASEAPRHGGAIGSVFAKGAHGFIDRLMPYMRGGDDAVRRDAARAIAATMLGALALARAVDDPAEASAILAAARQRILADHAAGQ
jgi:TetR/AcrR family transcriptional repressor of nem operon